MKIRHGSRVIPYLRQSRGWRYRFGVNSIEEIGDATLLIGLPTLRD